MDALAEKSDLFALLTMKLAGITVDKVGRKKSAFNTWSRANPDVKVDVAAEIREANLPGKRRAAARQSEVQARFNRLPKSERDEWEKESVRLHKQAEKDHAARLKQPPSKKAEDRQLYVAFHFGLSSSLTRNHQCTRTHACFYAANSRCYCRTYRMALHIFCWRTSAFR